jgi:peptide deformylase
MDPKDFYLRVEPDPILYKKLESYNFDCGMNAGEIEKKMIAIMENEYGMGISANQVGFDRRVIIIKPADQSPFAMFNPEIVNQQNQCEDLEGCLSFPGLSLKVTRSEIVTVKYLDKDQKECIITLSGYDAKCLQHEIDHLDGICFTNRVSKLKLEIARKKQRKNKW